MPDTEVAIIQVRDPNESEAGLPGEHELEDCETGDIRRDRELRKWRAGYRERFQIIRQLLPPTLASINCLSSPPIPGSILQTCRCNVRSWRVGL